MFKQILVPLDGSKLAEAALPAAASLAQALKAPVTLLHIIERNPPQEVHKDRHLTRPDEARAYLQEVARRAFPPKAKVNWHVHNAAVADVPRSIVEHAAAELQPDLIVMCTHGRGGVRDVLYGSIAQRVVAQGTIPLLLIKPEGEAPQPFRLGKIVVPLDSGPIHDDSLPAAQELARAYKAEIYLLTVIPTFSTMAGEEAAAGSLLPATTAALLDIKEENAKEDLGGHLAALRKAGIQAAAEVARGDPTAVIVDISERIGADLIVLSTHRKAGTAAFWARSVAPKVANRSTIPLLLIPILLR